MVIGLGKLLITLKRNSCRSISTFTLSKQLRFKILRKYVFMQVRNQTFAGNSLYEKSFINKSTTSGIRGFQKDS